jgi:hypothetical protein
MKVRSPGSLAPPTPKRPPTRWTRGLAIKFGVYLLVIIGLTTLIPEFRAILKFILLAVGVIAAGGAAIFLALMLAGFKAPRR